MLKLPGDEFVTLELVHGRNGPSDNPASALSHFVIQVDSMDATLNQLGAQGIHADAPTSPDGSHDFLTTRLIDPDGNMVELVQWPAGHAFGMSEVDFAQPET